MVRSEIRRLVRFAPPHVKKISTLVRTNGSRLIAFRLALIAAITLMGFLISADAQADTQGVYTQRNDNMRSGWNSNETRLTVSGVASNFGTLFTQTLDGVSYGQPLYVANVSIGGKSHNVVYMATQMNSVYAFDADTKQAPLWHVNLVPAGETEETSSDTGSSKIPVIGITSTPVIDPATGTIYVVTTTKTTSAPVVFHHRLHALAITSGAERANSPVEITGKFHGTGGTQDGSGNEVFTPGSEFNRAALLLANGEIFVAFGGYEDQHCYQGWVMAYDKTTLSPNAVLSLSPNLTCGSDRGASIWGSGLGLSADSNSIYLSTGNSLFDGSTGGGDWGDTTLKLGFNLSINDYFTPCNQNDLDVNDVDLGSGGVLLIPGTSLATLAGKEGTIYLLNTADMGKYTPPPAGFSDTTSPCTDNVVQKLWRALGQALTNTANRDAAYGIAGYYHDGSGKTSIYYAGSSDHLRAYTLSGSTLSFVNNNQTPDTFTSGGTIPVVSSNGTTSGTAIVWAIKRPHAGGSAALDAYDATNLTNQIVKDLQVSNWTTPSFPFLIPTVANGKVYTGGGVPGAGLLTVFGTSGSGSPPVVTISSPTNGATVSGTANIVVSEPSPPPGSWVNIYIDGKYLASSPPLTFSWNTTSVADGLHTIAAQIRDSSGQLAITSITVTVNNHSTPTPTPSVTPTPTPTPTPTATPTPTVTPTPMPIVTIAAPSNGATVSGTVNIVVSEPSPPPGSWVNIHIDGKYLASSPPLTFSWNTTSVANGPHTIDAQVKNSSGQIAITSISVTVAN